MKPIKAWYFAPVGNRLQFGDNRLIRTGITHSIEGDLKVCGNGLHGSKRIIDALNHAQTPNLYRTLHSGDVLFGADKLCSRKREYLKRYNMESILFEASRLFAKSNIKKIKPYVSKEDYKIIIKWLNTGNPKLRSAASSAAISAASSAARSAISARSAAWSAASSAARSAASSAARSARSARSVRSAESAESAARSAISARSAAWSAELAWSAESVWSAWSERSAEKTKQERMLLKLMRDKFGDL